MKKIVYGFIALLCISPLLSGLVFAAPEKPAVAPEKVVILFIEGDVKIKPAQGASWEALDVGMALYKGDAIKTGRDSWAEVGFGKGFMNVVRVKEETQVELTELGPVKLGLLKGELRSLVERLEKETTFEIKTPVAVCGARGTGWDTNAGEKQVVIDVYEDEVYFYILDKDENPIMDDPTISAEVELTIPADVPTAYTERDVPKWKMEDWNRWKEDYLDRRGMDKGVDIRTKTEQLESAQDVSDSFAKGKEGTFEKGQQEKIDNRVETKNTSSSTY